MEKGEAIMSSRRPQRKHSPGGLDSRLSRTLLLLLLSTASAREVTPNRAACVVSHAVNGSSVSCHPPAQIPRRFPADTVYLVVEFFNLTRLPDDTLGGLARLQELHLSNNQLESLSPKFLLPAPLLQVLDLTRNRLARLPPGLFRALAALHTLVLKENHLEALEPSWLLGLKALRHLDLSDNRLQSLPPGLLANVTSLRILDLSNNQLKALPPDLLKGPLRLERLHLEGNGLQVLGEGLLAPQPDLRYLFLNDNKLATVAAGALQGLRQLDFLDLSNNLLAGAPKGLWTSLGQPTRDMKDGFDVSGNPWICDGNLEDLYGWLVANKDKMFSRNATRCAGPEAWKGWLLGWGDRPGSTLLATWPRIHLQLSRAAGWTRLARASPNTSWALWPPGTLSQESLSLFSRISWPPGAPSLHGLPLAQPWPHWGCLCLALSPPL